LFSYMLELSSYVLWGRPIVAAAGLQPRERAAMARSKRDLKLERSGELGVVPSYFLARKSLALATRKATASTGLTRKSETPTGASGGSTK